MNEWNGHLEMFSCPQLIEKSRQYLLLRTDILQKTVVGCPGNSSVKKQKRSLDQLQHEFLKYLYCGLQSTYSVTDVKPLVSGNCLQIDWKDGHTSTYEYVRNGLIQFTIFANFPHQRPCIMREGMRNKPQGPGVFHGFRHIYFQCNVLYIRCFHCPNQVVYKNNNFKLLTVFVLPFPYIAKFLSSVGKFVMHLVIQLGSSFLYGCAQVTILLSELCHNVIWCALDFPALGVWLVLPKSLL